MTKRWVLNFLFMALGAFALLLALNLAGFGPALVQHESVRVVLPPSRSMQPAQKSVRQVTPRPAVPKPSVSAPVPRPETIINIYPQPAPPSSAQTPAPMPTPPPPVQPQVQPPAPLVPPQSALPPQTRTVNVLSGNTFQLKVEILSGNGSWNGGHHGYYGSTYGWTPGHAERICEPRSTGTICFDRWIAHPHPNY